MGRGCEGPGNEEVWPYWLAGHTGWSTSQGGESREKQGVLRATLRLRALFLRCHKGVFRRRGANCTFSFTR